MSKKIEIEVGGKKLSVSNLDKVLYPETGFTKGQIIDYYIRIAPVLLPHLKNRPITLKRYPDGVEGFFFYEKQYPSHRPGWVKTTVRESGALSATRQTIQRKNFRFLSLSWLSENRLYRTLNCQ